MAPVDVTTSGSVANSASTTVGMLTSIWQSLLRRSPIGVDDNFFSLGGNRRTADLLFADIARKMGREVPSATIFHAQTIAALASVLDRTTLPRFSPFVQIKAGTKKPPILIAPGLDGCTSFSKLAKRIQTEHPIYGIQAKGVDGMENPFDCVEDMARYYVEELNELQPCGPYILIGYSFGGLVALEMAQRLSDGGKHVGLLVLIDAYPHPRTLSTGQRLRLTVQRAVRHISEMRQRPIGGAIAYLLDIIPGHVLNAVEGVLHPVNTFGLDPINRMLSLNPLGEFRETGAAVQTGGYENRRLLGAGLYLHKRREAWKGGPIQDRSQGRDRLGVEDRGTRHFPAHLPSDISKQQVCCPTIAPETKEVIVDPDGRPAEQRLPN